MTRKPRHGQPSLPIQGRCHRTTAAYRRWHACNAFIFVVQLLVPQTMTGDATLTQRDAELLQHVVQAAQVALEIPLRRAHVRVAAVDHLLGGFKRWSATHVPPAQNSTADRLANEALDRVAAGGPARVARARRVTPG